MAASARVCALLVAILAGLAAGAPGPARAGDLRLRAPGLVGRERVVMAHRPDRHPTARSERAGLEAFAAERRLEARARVRGLLREGERRLETLRLRAEGGPEDVTRATARWRAENAADARRDRIDLDALERRTGWPLRPFTRTLLEERLEGVHREQAARSAHQAEALRERAQPALPTWAEEVPGPVAPR